MTVRGYHGRNLDHRVVLVVEELAPKVNQSSAYWVPKANPQRGLWVVLKANQPSLVLLLVGVELAPKVNQSSASWAPKANP